MVLWKSLVESSTQGTTRNKQENWKPWTVKRHMDVQSAYEIGGAFGDEPRQHVQEEGTS